MLWAESNAIKLQLDKTGSATVDAAQQIAHLEAALRAAKDEINQQIKAVTALTTAHTAAERRIADMERDRVSHTEGRPLSPQCCQCCHRHSSHPQFVPFLLCLTGVVYLVILLVVLLSFLVFVLRKITPPAFPFPHSVPHSCKLPPKYNHLTIHPTIFPSLSNQLSFRPFMSYYPSHCPRRDVWDDDDGGGDECSARPGRQARARVGRTASAGCCHIQTNLILAQSLT